MKFLEKALYTVGGLLAGSILAFNVACSQPAPAPTPNLEATVQARVKEILASSTPTSVIQLQRSTVQPTPTLTQTPSPTATPVPPTPTPKPILFSQKFDTLLSFVEKNYFKIPTTMELSYPTDKSSFIREWNFNLDIPYTEAFSLQDSIGGYVHYAFFYVDPTVKSRVPQLKNSLTQKGWKSYRDGVFGPSSGFYNTWIKFEDSRFVTISTRRERDNLGEAVDNYILNKPDVELSELKPFVVHARKTIPREFDNTVSSVFINTDGRLYAVASFNDSEGGFRIIVESGKQPGDFSGNMQIGGYNVSNKYWENDQGKRFTDMEFYCRPDLKCLIRAEWGLKPSSVGIKARLEKYLNSISQLFASQD